MTAKAVLLTERDDSTIRLVLNRPDKLNSLTAELIAALKKELQQIADDEAVRCVILTGSGRAFCAGQDLNERRAIIEGGAVDLGETLERGINSIIRLIRALPQPVICAVRGAAAGAGANLALACDIVLASRSARFVETFSRIGLIPDGGGTWTLARKAGLARAKGMVLLGEPVSGETAQDWGLIWKCVDDNALDAAVDEMAQDLASRSFLALARAKQALNAAAANDLDAQLDIERDFQSELGRTEEYRAAVVSFLKKM